MMQLGTEVTVAGVVGSTTTTFELPSAKPICSQAWPLFGRQVIPSEAPTSGGRSTVEVVPAR
jgi:hypothetical protein